MVKLVTAVRDIVPDASHQLSVEWKDQISL
jgi:hypothetical protein